MGCRSAKELVSIEALGLNKDVTRWMNKLRISPEDFIYYVRNEYNGRDRFEQEMVRIAKEHFEDIPLIHQEKVLKKIEELKILLGAEKYRIYDAVKRAGYIDEELEDRNFGKSTENYLYGWYIEGAYPDDIEAKFPKCYHKNEEYESFVPIKSWQIEAILRIFADILREPYYQKVKIDIISKGEGIVTDSDYKILFQAKHLLAKKKRLICERMRKEVFCKKPLS